MRGILYIFEDSLIPFLPYVPNNKTWKEGPSKVENFVIRKISPPTVKGVSNTLLSPVKLLKDVGKSLP